MAPLSFATYNISACWIYKKVSNQSTSFGALHTSAWVGSALKIVLDLHTDSSIPSMLG